MDNECFSSFPARVRDAEAAGDWTAAEDLMARAAATGSPFWRVGLADLLCWRGRPAEALALTEAVLAEHPGYAGALRVRGMALFRLGRLSEAQAALEAAWGIRPAPAVAWSLARVCRRAAGVAAALQWAERALRVFPEDTRLLRERASLLLRLGRDAEAAEAAGRVLRSEPGDGRALATWAAARIRSLPPEEAAEHLGRLLQLPRLRAVPQLWALHARSLERAGKPAAALRSWRAAASSSPGDRRAAADLVFALRRCVRRSEAFDGLAALVRADPADAAVLSAFVYDARLLSRQGSARQVLFDLLRRDPGRRHLWGWVRRLGLSPGPTRPANRARPVQGMVRASGGKTPAAPPDGASGGRAGGRARPAASAAGPTASGGCAQRGKTT